ncbi:DUF3363 domain-containing protein [Mesorhizobium sp.]|uniref:DUF3363 domain-containing protein n=2 Tax=unclassified Mesorhizobium TaxID=325217 RepID=UPI0025F1A0A6|nr:DUF3363 domain-containing protein [Mesorhizobium sp.]
MSPHPGSFSFVSGRRRAAAWWVRRARRRSGGREVHEAQARRRQWLISQGLAHEQQAQIVYRANMISILRQRELNRIAGQLAEELGLPCAEAQTGNRIQGTLRRSSIELASGKYAVVEKSREFTLVRWRPVLDRQLASRSQGSWAGREFPGPSVDRGTGLVANKPRRSWNPKRLRTALTGLFEPSCTFRTFWLAEYLACGNNRHMDSPNTYEIAPPRDVRGRHIRAARILLDWTKARAAQECGVGVNTIGRFEEGLEKLTSRTVGAIVRTFEANGVMFVRADVGAGVFLRNTLDGE